MIPEIVPNSCRICLQRSAKLRSIYKPLEEGEEPLNVMLQDVTGIVLKEGTGHSMEPHSICRDCELTLNMSFQFRLKALKAQRIIESLLKTDDNNDNKIEIEDKLNESVQNPLADEETNKNDFVKEEVEFLDDSIIELDVDSPESVDCKPNMSLEETNDNFLSEEEEEEITQLDIELNADIEEFKEEDTVPATKRNKRDKIKKSSKRRNKTKPDEISLVRVKKPKPLPVQEKKQLKCVKDEGNHICDICGNTFAQRGRMVEHRRRHNKELAYPCEVCDKSFFTAEQLRKHLFSHSGGKPLKCNFCSRSFFYESVRRAHEAVHQGHKPFVCTECGKAFAYSHTLKKHLLIHKNIKLYRCSHCNKDFRLLHHLKQHLESKCHQIQVQMSGNAHTKSSEG